MPTEQLRLTFNASMFLFFFLIQILKKPQREHLIKYIVVIIIRYQNYTFKKLKRLILIFAFGLKRLIRDLHSVIQLTMIR